MIAEQLIHAAECQPCACGKRKTSEPQILASEIDVRLLAPLESDETCKRHSAQLICGVCGHRHKFALLERNP